MIRRAAAAALGLAALTACASAGVAAPTTGHPAASGTGSQQPVPTGTASTGSASDHPAPTAHHFAGNRTVGPLFMPHQYPALHTCTASVLRSAHHDVAVTAAHCITGRGSGYVFAPGYRNGRTPFGVWHVVRVYGSPRWIHAGGRHRGTQRDWAFLVLARQTRNGRRVGVQDVTGGNRLGLVARDGTVVHVPGYGVGAADTAVTCRARVYHHHGYPAFDCGGYVGGTSGSPWLLRRHHRRIVVGVIGGLHQGGCTPSTSYSSRLGRPARLAFRRAERGRPGDRFPSPPSDGC